MRALKAHVTSGRIVVDEPTDLPEGTELELVPADEFGITPEERSEIDAMIEESEAELARGEAVSLDELWARLRSIP